ncbi:hypothetical protein ONZ51_g12708 [Trametes cubensis]|uniref:Protein HRI1 n=1 Tax=Trametes cubensis TaxID=1111947 RepID=A0AAD7X3F5_9APHY|nr:hypothetical protein ONZ51_g12708 [Trametes cubensis]
MKRVTSMHVHASQRLRRVLRARTYNSHPVPPSSEIVIRWRVPYKFTMSISERLYIRWIPDEPSEPTSTLVLTTPRHRHFIDLRLSSPSLDTLEWGFSGSSVGTPTHGKWIHEISSRIDHPDGEADEGDMFPHPTLPDVELERGRMRRPDTGEIREYEEAWKAVPVVPGGGGGPRPLKGDKRVSVWLEMQDTATDRRGSIVRVGQYCQGIVRDGSKISVQRWMWTDGTWAKVGQIGDFDIPCNVTWSTLDEGEAREHDGDAWEVKEVTAW